MEIRCEKPMFCAVPQSASPASTAPDCATAAMRPALSWPGPKLALRPMPRRGVADAVRPDDAQQMRPGGAQDALAPARIVLAP